MIGPQPTGAIAGVTITAAEHEGLTVIVDGRPGCLAIADELGCVVAEGGEVALEAREVAANCYRSVWRGYGHVRVFSNQLGDEARETGKDVRITAVAHEGLSVTVDGKAGRLVLMDGAGDFVESRLVAREVEAVAINSVRDDLIQRGLLRVLARPPGR